MEKGYGMGKPPEEYHGPSWTTIRRNYWKEQAVTPNSKWHENERASTGNAPIENGQKIILHHPQGVKEEISSILKKCLKMNIVIFITKTVTDMIKKMDGIN